MDFKTFSILTVLCVYFTSGQDTIHRCADKQFDTVLECERGNISLVSFHLGLSEGDCQSPSEDDRRWNVLDIDRPPAKTFVKPQDIECEWNKCYLDFPAQKDLVVVDGSDLLTDYEIISYECIYEKTGSWLLAGTASSYVAWVFIGLGALIVAVVCCKVAVRCWGERQERAVQPTNVKRLSSFKGDSAVYDVITDKDDNANNSNSKCTAAPSEALLAADGDQVYSQTQKSCPPPEPGDCEDAPPPPSSVTLSSGQQIDIVRRAPAPPPKPDNFHAELATRLSMESVHRNPKTFSGASSPSGLYTHVTPVPSNAPVGSPSADGVVPKDSEGEPVYASGFRRSGKSNSLTKPSCPPPKPPRVDSPTLEKPPPGNVIVEQATVHPPPKPAKPGKKPPPKVPAKPKNLYSKAKAECVEPNSIYSEVPPDNPRCSPEGEETVMVENLQYVG